MYGTSPRAHAVPSPPQQHFQQGAGQGHRQPSEQYPYYAYYQQQPPIQQQFGYPSQQQYYQGGQAGPGAGIGVNGNGMPAASAPPSAAMFSAAPASAGQMMPPGAAAGGGVGGMYPGYYTTGLPPAGYPGYPPGNINAAAINDNSGGGAGAGVAYYASPQASPPPPGGSAGVGLIAKGPAVGMPKTAYASAPQQQQLGGEYDEEAAGGGGGRRKPTGAEPIPAPSTSAGGSGSSFVAEADRLVRHGFIRKVYGILCAQVGGVGVLATGASVFCVHVCM